MREEYDVGARGPPNAADCCAPRLEILSTWAPNVGLRWAAEVTHCQPRIGSTRLGLPIPCPRAMPSNQRDLSRAVQLLLLPVQGPVGVPAARTAERVRPGGPVLNELMASNTETLADEDGDFFGWIELRIDGPVAVDLEVWSLKDDPNALAEGSFPQTALLLGEHLVTFASGQDRAIAGARLHTNFKLRSSGEFEPLEAIPSRTAGRPSSTLPATSACCSRTIRSLLPSSPRFSPRAASSTCFSPVLPITYSPSPWGPARATCGSSWRTPANRAG